MGRGRLSPCLLFYMESHRREGETQTYRGLRGTGIYKEENRRHGRKV